MLQNFSDSEAKSFVDATAPRLGCGDFTYNPSFPEGRNDVCLVSRAVEDGYSYGYSIVYLVWKSKDNMRKEELADTRETKDYLNYSDLKVENNILSFNLNNGSGAYSGKTKSGVIRVDLNKLQV